MEQLLVPDLLLDRPLKDPPVVDAALAVTRRLGPAFQAARPVLDSHQGGSVKHPLWHLL